MYVVNRGFTVSSCTVLLPQEVKTFCGAQAFFFRLVLSISSFRINSFLKNEVNSKNRCFEKQIDIFFRICALEHWLLLVLNWLGGCHSERVSKEPYLNAFLGPLCAVHHGGEGERGDETTQEVLGTHAQDGHTWERERTSKRNHCKSTKLKFCQKKKDRKFTLLSAALHFSLCCSVWKSKRGHKAGRIGEQPPPPPILLFPITATTHPSPSPSPQLPLVPKSHVAYPRRGRGGAVGKHRGTTEPICLCCLQR